MSENNESNVIDNKISYYVNKFRTCGLKKEFIEEFKNDRTMCHYSDMPCEVCSCGCFKINVIWELSAIFGDNRIMKLLI